jgi:hypothetical protein
MNALFDKLAFSRRLEGDEMFSRRQAEGLADALDTALRDGVATSQDVERARVATQQDIARLRAEVEAGLHKAGGDVAREIAAVRADMSKEFAAVRADTSREFAAVRADMSKEFAAVRSDTALLRSDLERKIEVSNRELKVWFFGALLGGLALLFAALRLIP